MLHFTNIMLGKSTKSAPSEAFPAYPTEIGDQRLRPETRDTDTGTSLAVDGFHISGLPIQHLSEVIDFSCAKRIHAATHGIMTEQPAFLGGGNTIWKNELKELSNTES